MSTICNIGSSMIDCLRGTLSPAPRARVVYDYGSPEPPMMQLQGTWLSQQVRNPPKAKKHQYVSNEYSQVHVLAQSLEDFGIFAGGKAIVDIEDVNLSLVSGYSNARLFFCPINVITVHEKIIKSQWLGKRHPLLSVAKITFPGNIVKIIEEGNTSMRLTLKNVEVHSGGVIYLRQTKDTCIERKEICSSLPF